MHPSSSKAKRGRSAVAQPPNCTWGTSATACKASTMQPPLLLQARLCINESPHAPVGFPHTHPPLTLLRPGAAPAEPRSCSCSFACPAQPDPSSLQPSLHYIYVTGP